MLAIERHRKILEIAKRDGAVKTQGLSAILGVTEETVRRDLDALDRQGLLRRTHGGATEVSMALHELPQSERVQKQAAEKAMIAKAAAGYVGENETLMLDASSTALEFARHLPEGRRLRVVTYAQDVIDKLSIRNDLELVLLGGVFDAKGRRFRGMITEMGLRSMRIDRFFFSGGGFDPALGIGEPNPEEARLKSTVIVHAKWKCALMDHTKLGGKTDHFFAKPSEIDLFITDSKGADFCKSPAMRDMQVVIA